MEKKRREYLRKWRAANPGKNAEYNKKSYIKHKETRCAHSKEYRTENREKVLEKSTEHYHSNKEYYKQRNRESYLRNRLRRSIESQQQRAFIKETIMKHYSNGDIKCVECDINDIDMLTLDHINNNGAEHKREIGSHRKDCKGIGMYGWIVKNDFPKGFQVLCWNHNIKKGLIKTRENIIGKQVV
jgi:hypothetical protein